MINTSELLKSLSDMMTVSGFEKSSESKLRELLKEHFDKIEKTPVGNFYFVKNCNKDDAKTLMIDTHFDEIGFIVSGITDDGFIRLSRVGGIDTRILPAERLVVYGKETFKVVVVSTPPHLQKPDEEKKLPEVSDLLCDTGYTKDKLLELAPIGTPVGFVPNYTELLPPYVCGKGFDNKACAAAAILAATQLDPKDMQCNIAILLSTREEVGMVGGMTGAFDILPDAAIVLDVNLSDTPGVEKYKTVKTGAGPSVSLSMTLDHDFVQDIISFAKKKDIKHQVIAEPRSTGTNADIIPLVANGIPTAVVSIPLKNMHTATEIISLEDLENTALLIAEYVKEGEMPW